MKIFRTFIISASILVLLAIMTFCINYFANNNVGLTEYTFESEKLPYDFDGYKIMVISDFHNADFSEQILKHAAENQPDILLFTGDMVQLPDSNLDNVLKIINNIPKEMGIYAVSGNHESQNSHYKEIMDTLYANGVHTLDGTDMYLKKGNSRIKIMGIMDPPAETDKVTDDMIENIKELINSFIENDPNCFNILAFHRSTLYKELKDLKLDLILSGHTHGGVIRLPIVGGIIGESVDDYVPDYTSGAYKDGFATMIVSRGCDKNIKKMRVFNPPEVLMVNLKKIY